MTHPPPDLELKFGGRLVEQLGAQLYPSATATVAELISNAWDADARNVWVEMPFGDWAGGEIVVIDDGVGMDTHEADQHYLVVGRNRRANGEQRTPGGRLVHGRKGIGKLAAFGTASILEVRTKKIDSPAVAFRLDYDKIRQQEPTSPYRVESSTDDARLANPMTDIGLAQGTRIRLSGLRLKRRLNSGRFRESMSRRFALNEHEMKVFINAEPLARFEVDVDLRFPPASLPREATRHGDWAVETLGDGHEVRWWIGFTAKPIKDETQRGISVIVRGKLAQRPFMFEAGGGTTGQLGQQYLVGEVIADWIDDESADPDTDTDYIQSNRDQLQLEDEDLKTFLAWGQRRLRWALAARGDFRNQILQERLEENEQLQELFEGRSKREVAALSRVADAVGRLPEVSDQEVVNVMTAVVGACDRETTRALAHDISLEGADPERLWKLLKELAELDARSALAFIGARLEALAQLREIEVGDEVGAVAEMLVNAPALFDPAWERHAVVEQYQPAKGLRLFLTDDGTGTNSTAVLVPSGEADYSELGSVMKEIGNSYPDTEVFLLATGDSVIGAMSWQEVLESSERAHVSWRSLVEQRLRSARRQ